MDITIGYMKPGKIKIPHAFSEKEWGSMSSSERQQWAERQIELTCDEDLLEGMKDFPLQHNFCFDETPSLAFVYGYTCEDDILENRTPLYEAYHKTFSEGNASMLGEEIKL